MTRLQLPEFQCCLREDADTGASGRMRRGDPTFRRRFEGRTAVSAMGKELMRDTKMSHTRGRKGTSGAGVVC